MGFIEHRLNLWDEVEVTGSEIWQVGWVLKHSDVFIGQKLLHRLRCGLARCPDDSSF
jgi:hypothetical protein